MDATNTANSEDINSSCYIVDVQSEIIEINESCEDGQIIDIKDNETMEEYQVIDETGFNSSLEGSVIENAPENSIPKDPVSFNFDSC